MDGKDQSRVCDQCGRWVEKREILYLVMVTVQAEAPDELVLEMPESADAAAAAWKEAIEEMEAMGEEESREASAQVYEEHHFALCPECRGELRRRLRTHEKLLE